MYIYRYIYTVLLRRPNTEPVYNCGAQTLNMCYYGARTLNCTTTSWCSLVHYTRTSDVHCTSTSVHRPNTCVLLRHPNIELCALLRRPNTEPVYNYYGARTLNMCCYGARTLDCTATAPTHLCTTTAPKN